MRHFLSAVMITVFALTLSVPAFAAVEFTGQAATTLQSLDSELGDEEVGFGSARFNLQVHGDVASGITGFAEIHNNDLADTIAGLNALSELWDEDEIALREAYITFHDLFPHAYLKVGRADLLFGTQYMDRTVNARAQDNPLIGNHLTDFGGPETGLHVGGQFPLREANLGIDWYAAVTNGTHDASVEDGQSLAFTGTLGLEIFTAGYLKGSYHTVDHDENDVVNGTDFFAAEPEPYVLAQGVSNLAIFRNPIVVFHEVDAWQVDARYELQDLMLSGYVGNNEAHGGMSMGTTDADYWTVQADWGFTPRSGLAGRFSNMDIEDADGNSDGDIVRTQVGVYHQYRENVLAKLEYVTQEDNDDVSGNDSLEFDGVVGELSVAF